MIFRQWDEILTGEKTQTRRIVKPEHFLNRWHLEGETDTRINEVLIGSRSLWVVGKTYAVVPKRGARAVARIRITGIRQERLQEISKDDAIAEGIWRSSTGWKFTDSEKTWMNPVYAFASYGRASTKHPAHDGRITRSCGYSRSSV